MIQMNLTLYVRNKNAVISNTAFRSDNTNNSGSIYIYMCDVMWCQSRIKGPESQAAVQGTNL